MLSVQKYIIGPVTRPKLLLSQRLFSLGNQCVRWRDANHERGSCFVPIVRPTRFTGTSIFLRARPFLMTQNGATHGKFEIPVSLHVKSLDFDENGRKNKNLPAFQLTGFRSLCPTVRNGSRLLPRPFLYQLRWAKVFS